MEGGGSWADTTNIRWRVIVREVVRYYWRKGQQQIIVNKRKLGEGERKRRNETARRETAIFASWQETDDPEGEP